MSTIQTVFTDGAPVPAGHYSQAVVHNGLIYVSGQLPIDENGVKMTDAPVSQQAEQVLRNVAAILESAGSARNQVLQMTLYVADVEHWGEVNRVYAEFFGEHKPARAVVPVKELHYGLAIEVQAIAAIPAA